jgi:hypothetical protein
MRTLRAVRAMLARPTALADALALRSGTTTALHTVATTLAHLTAASASTATRAQGPPTAPVEAPSS